jgi:hypothetical protein
MREDRSRDRRTTFLFGWLALAQARNFSVLFVLLLAPLLLLWSPPGMAEWSGGIVWTGQVCNNSPGVPCPPLPPQHLSGGCVTSGLPIPPSFPGPLARSSAQSSHPGSERPIKSLSRPVQPQEQAHPDDLIIVHYWYAVECKTWEQACSFLAAATGNGDSTSTLDEVAGSRTCTAVSTDWLGGIYPQTISPACFEPDGSPSNFGNPDSDTGCTPELFFFSQDGRPGYDGTPGTPVIASNQTNTVVVGEPIELTLSAPASDITSAAWTIRNTAIGQEGYNATTAVCDSSSNCPSATAFDNSNDITFYWTKPISDGENKIQYTCSACQPKTGPLKATFDVVAPTGANVTTTIRPIVIEPEPNGIPLLSLGDPDKTTDGPVRGLAGAKFDVIDSTVDLKGYQGTYQWVQIVRKLHEEYDAGGKTYETDCVEDGQNTLDTIYPTDKGVEFVDSPDLKLLSELPDLPGQTVSKAVLDEDFTMYLQWAPGTLNGNQINRATPVTLGHFTWSVHASATLRSGAESQWQPAGGGKAGDFVPGDEYPTWSISYSKFCPPFTLKQ